MFRGSNCRSIYMTTLCLSAVLFSTARLEGQAVAIAQVSGVVTDQSGSAVPNAQVRMTEVDKALPHTTVSDSGGQYALPNLPVGPYRLEVEAPGFKNYTQTGIVLQVGNNITLNVVL